MKAKEILKKEIIVETIALILFVGACLYATITLKNKNTNDISEHDGIVAILDDKKVSEVELYSDGEGLDSNGITYTITNNNDKAVSYEIVISTNVHDEDILKQLRISLDDVYISDLVSLERKKGGYVLGVKTLNPGYTKIHTIKYWYKLDSDKENIDKNIKFMYKLELV